MKNKHFSKKNSSLYATVCCSKVLCVRQFQSWTKFRNSCMRQKKLPSRPSYHRWKFYTFLRRVKNCPLKILYVTIFKNFFFFWVAKTFWKGYFKIFGTEPPKLLPFSHILATNIILFLLSIFCGILEKMYLPIVWTPL